MLLEPFDTIDQCLELGVHLGPPGDAAAREPAIKERFRVRSAALGANVRWRSPPANRESRPRLSATARALRSPAAWIVAAGLALRAVLVSRAGVIEHDGAYYSQLAAALWTGGANALSPVWPPGYPAAIAVLLAPAALLHRLDPATLEFAARAVSWIAGGLLLTLMYVWMMDHVPRRTALVTLALAATHPRLAQYSAAALTETMFCALLLAGLALLGRAMRDADGRTELAAGVAFGLAYLTRPEGLPLAAAAWLGAVIAGGARRWRPALLIGLVVVVLPWLAFLRAELGHVSLGEKGPYNFWRAYKTEYDARLGTPGRLSERVFDSPALARAVPPAPVHVARFVAVAPGVVAARTAHNLGRIVAQSLPLACYPAWFVFAMFGLPWFARRPLWPAAALLLALPVIYAPFGADRRFFVPAVPLLLGAAAIGIETIAAWFAPARRAAVGLALVAALSVGGVIYVLAHPLMESAPEHRAAGEWLARKWPRLGSAASTAAAPANHRDEPARAGRPGIVPSHPHPIVMSRKTWVAFYAGGAIAELPDVPLDSLPARARAAGADVLVFDARWALPNRPRLAPLLDPATAPAGFRLLHVEPGPMRLVLYDVRGAR